MHRNIPMALRLKITPVAPIVKSIPESAKYVAKLGSIFFSSKSKNQSSKSENWEQMTMDGNL